MSRLLLSEIVEETLAETRDATGRAMQERYVPVFMGKLFKGVKLTGDSGRVDAIKGLCAETGWRRGKQAGDRARGDALADAINGGGAHRVFGVHEQYALDLEERSIKLTDEMVELEFLRLIGVRKASVERDLAHIAVLEDAHKALRPYWRRDPALTFKEATGLYLRDRAAAE
jgi:hypothetical protein